MAKQKVKVTGLALETKDGKKVSLTLDEAKDLHEQLDQLFGKEVRYIPSQPVYVRPWWQQAPYYWTTADGNYRVGNNTTGLEVTYQSGQNTTTVTT